MRFTLLNWGDVDDARRRTHRSKGFGRYNGTMEETLDETILLALCVTLMTWQWGDEFAVAGCLGAIALTCLCHLLEARWRIVAQCLYYGIACFVPSFLLFLPVVTYDSMHERPWTARLIWVVPLGMGLLSGFASPAQILAEAILCCVACVLAIRDIRARSERDGLRFAYYDLRERNLRLHRDLERTQALSEDRGKASPCHEEAFADLTKRELAVAKLVAEGMDNREIAAKLFLSEGTVRNHISAILAKKQLSNRTQIAVAYYRGS